MDAEDADEEIRRMVEEAVDTAQHGSLAATIGPHRVIMFVKRVANVSPPWEFVVTQLGKEMDWQDTLPRPPIISVHMGSLLDRAYAQAKTGEREVWCLMFGCPTQPAQQQVADLLRALSVDHMVDVQTLEEDGRDGPYSLMDTGFLTPRCWLWPEDVGNRVFSRVENGFTIAFPTTTDDADLLPICPAPRGLEVLEQNLRRHGLHWDEFP